MPFLRDLKTQFMEFMAQQSMLKRLMAGGALLVVLVALVYQTSRIGRTVNYELLYAGLDAQMASTVRQELQRQGIEPVIEESPRGWAIRVPEGKALSLRLDMAPSLEAAEGDKGWKLFDDKDFTTTFYALQVKKQRAIMGELARTIKRMDHVRNATVNVSIPEKSPFIQDEKLPTASVMLTLTPGADFGKSQVRTIQAFVAGSIEGLKPDSVVVTDTGGRELSRTAGGGKMGDSLEGAERVIEMRKNHGRDYERYLEQKILAQFSPIFGANHVAASVNVDFDYTTKRETEAKYDPKTVAVSTMEKTAGGGASGGRVASGIAGATIQVTNAAGASSATAAARPSDMSSERISNLMVGKKETETVYPEYQIKRISTAVFLDNTPARTPAADGAAPAAPTADKTEETRKELEKQVKAIVGYSQERPGGAEDVVTVTSMPFGTAPDALPEAPESWWKEWLKQLRGWWIVWAVILSLVFFMVVRPLMRVVAPAPGQAALGGPRQALALEGGAAGMLAGDGADGLTYDGLQRSQLPAPPVASDVMEAQQSQMDDSILEAARANPKKVPLVLRAWMES